MLAWIIIIGLLAGGAVICAIEGLATGDTALLVGAIMLEAILIPLFIVLLIKRLDPKYHEKKQERQEKKREEREYWEKLNAGAAEREQLRKKFKAEEKAEKFQAERLRTNIVATRLIGEGAAEYKKSVGSMAVRGAVGSVFGPAGTVIGMATAKNKNVKKNVRRFLVKYQDGHVEEKEATIGSKEYKIYMSFLEWE